MNKQVKLSNRKLIDKTVPTITNAAEIFKAYSAHGDKECMKYLVGGQVKVMTYREYADRILYLSAAFASWKLEGKRVVIIGETSPEWLTAYNAALLSGAVAVPMDKELAVPEIEKFMEIVEADTVVYSKSFNEKFLGTIENHKTLRHFVPITNTYESDFGGKVFEFESLIELGRREVEAGYRYNENPDNTKMCEMLFTSGTTGTSKCVTLCQKNVFSVVTCAARETSFDGNDVILSVLPVHHTYELACIQAGMLLGMTVCINDTLRHFMKNVSLFKPTGLVLVPLFVTTMYKKLWTEAEKSGQAAKLKKGLKISGFLMKLGIDVRRKLFKSVLNSFGGNLNKIICGGARIDPEVISAFDRMGIPIYEGYGITECSPLAAVTPYTKRKCGSVGPAVQCCSIRIDPNGQKSDDGFDLGEIQIKGDNVMLGYYKNDEANADSFTSDGWFRTGDVGYTDRDGYVYITGRMKFVIVLENGKNVFPEEIEEYLEGVDKIAECVVIGRQSESGDEVILTAVCYPDFSKYPEDATDEQITSDLKLEINRINRNLPSFKQIKAVEIRRTEFEKTTTKKIKRNLVK